MTTRKSWACSRDHLRVCGADFVGAVTFMLSTGSPPRVRSRRQHDDCGGFERRITSACAEQTMAVGLFVAGAGDHLRVCGADLFQRLVSVGYEWITSACAEQTNTPAPEEPVQTDHLRVCGADKLRSPVSRFHQGSPPRVRSRPCALSDDLAGRGITSACAEQTGCPTCKWQDAGDHLRVCGADGSGVLDGLIYEGSPPRVRSRLHEAYVEHLQSGITSACAEQTHWLVSAAENIRDHLRVCGADPTIRKNGSTIIGSPPRVRSRQSVYHVCNRAAGITSACAEQTNNSNCRLTGWWDHLRVCGADDDMKRFYDDPEGSPPRVRSRLSLVSEVYYSGGITSACAEQTPRCHQ